MNKGLVSNLGEFLVFLECLDESLQKNVRCATKIHANPKLQYFIIFRYFSVVRGFVDLPHGGGVLGLRTYGDVPLENLKSYPVPESKSRKWYPVPEENFLEQYPVL